MRAARRGVGWLPDATRRWRRCSPAVSSRAEAAQVPGPQGEQELLSLISVRISIVGEELSGATRPNSGRGDGCFLLVSYQDASTQPPQPKAFHSLCATGQARSICFRLLLWRLVALESVATRETGPGAPTALPTGSV